eukprot:GHVU01116605.1.p1 GENE.GHVU01116605.1~~GHVU01116605.1.p1  ORF type:complete len:274 (-),score=31.75 GHVU01116605.1:416-1237(-)
MTNASLILALVLLVIVSAGEVAGEAVVASYSKLKAEDSDEDADEVPLSEIVKSKLKDLCAPQKLVGGRMKVNELRDLLEKLKAGGCGGVNLEEFNMNSHNLSGFTADDHQARLIAWARSDVHYNCPEEIRLKVLADKLFPPGSKPILMNIRENFAKKKSFFGKGLLTRLRQRFVKGSVLENLDLEQAQLWVLDLVTLLTKETSSEGWNAPSTFMSMDDLKTRYEEAIEFVRDKVPAYAESTKGMKAEDIANMLLDPAKLKSLLPDGFSGLISL